MSFVVRRSSFVVVRKRFAGLFSLIIALAAMTSTRPLTARAQTVSLLEGFIEALNTKDRAKIEAFVTANFADSNIPMATRLDRTVGVAEQGAPFKVVRTLPATPQELRAEIEDKNGQRLGMKLRLSPAGKIMGIMIGDPEELDAPAPKDYRGWTSLASLTESIRKDTESPGMSVAYYRNGRIEQAASGFREVGKPAPVLTSDIFSIGSIGKPITSTLIGRLIEMGKLRWDTTLGEALPGVTMKDGYRAVTLEQIMHHRGGIPQFLRVTDDDIQRITAGGETDPMKLRMNAATGILGMDPIAKPGERFAYSNGGYLLLGVIAEQTMKKPYERLVHELVLKPLGMKHTYMNGDALPEGRVSGHVKGNGPGGEPAPNAAGLRPMNFSGPIEFIFAPAGGGTWSTADDLVRFGLSHMKGLRGEDDLLKATTVRRLHQGIPEGQPGPEARSYGCGWGIEPAPGIETFHGHNGSNGTQRSQLAIFPKAGIVVAAFVNRGGEAEPAPGLQAVLAIGQRFAMS